MLRVALVLFVCIVHWSASTPTFTRSYEEIHAFRSHLEATKNDNDGFLLRSKANPKANPEELSGKFEGDMLLDDWMIDALTMDYATGGRSAYIWPDTKWPNDTVVWEFGEGEFGPLQSAAIEDGIRDIEEHTCLKFRYKQPEDEVFVQLTGNAGGCYAHVGYWEERGLHVLNLARNYPGVGCFRHATIVHEWMHILGIFHMQSTHDRDEYVEIREENLVPGTENNFEKYSEELVSNHGVEYDYVSCMHYSRYAFSANGEPTIIALQEHDGLMGQREYITEKDWARVNRHYNCPGAWDN